MKFSAAKLRRLRKRRGWTQRDLAEHLEVDPMTVSRWERGLSHPRRVVCDRLQSMVQTAVSQATRVAGTNRRLSVSERIDELVRVIGIDTALRALREVALLERKPIPVRFVDEPAKRLREVEAALDEQRTLLARAKIR